MSPRKVQLAARADQAIRKRFQIRAAGAPKLSDVAILAGVSTATVSRCLNGPGSVRPALRERVEAAVRRLGYVPHGAARALASQRSKTIGAVVPTFDNAIFASGIQALQRRLSEAGYTLLLACSDYDPANELRQIESLVARGVDGVMLVGEARDPRVYRLLAAKSLPYVNAWIYKAASAHPCVGFDNREAACRLARYIIDIGHTEIAMIAGITVHNDRAAERVAGVRQALAERGLRLAPGRLVESPYNIADGRLALRQVLSAARPPTAVICGNDVLAFGALFEAQRQGIEVPDRLSISGFDDLELASQLDPPLTTMRVPTAEMGRRAAEYLLARLGNRPTQECVALEVGLTVRGTTAPPRRAT
jgi:LacI family transcriptional regulator